MLKIGIRQEEFSEEFSDFVEGAIVGTQRGCDLPVAAAEMDDQAAPPFLTRGARVAPHRG